MSAEAFFGNMPYLAAMPSCVLYLRGANGSNILDWSPNKATITNSGGVNSTVQSKFPPSSLYFNGASNYSATITQGTKLNFGANPYAISLWVYVTALDRFEGNCLQIGHHAAGGAFWELGLVNGPGVALYLYNNGYLYQPCKTTSILNGWHHVFARYDGTYANVWVDGSVGTQSAAYTGGFFPTGDVYFNRSYDNGEYAYNTAFYDEVAVWNGAYGDVPTISDIYTGHGYNRRLIVG